MSESGFIRAVWWCLLVVVLFLNWNAGSSGLARLLATYGTSTDQIDPANAAVRLSPNDAEVHYLRGLILDAHGDLPEAIDAYQKAASLRPGDYLLWLSLARVQELNGDGEGALAAATKAVKLAPYYAQPRWQLGNILVRAGRREEGFQELSLAGASDRTLLPAIIDLAWQISGGDIKFIRHALGPRDLASYVALGEYLKKRGEVPEAIAMFSAAGTDAEAVRARQQFLAELINAKKFKEAHALWSIAHPLDPDGPPVFDSGFEQESNLDEPGFGWRATNPAPSLTLSLDNSNPREGHSSLRVDFNGESNPNAPIISQPVLLEPKTHYQLRLAFRTEDLVSGGLPGVLIIDPSDNKVLGQTGALRKTTDGWSEAKIDFTTGESTTAIQVALQREPCSKTQCPIFGRLWLDAFELRNLGEVLRP